MLRAGWLRLSGYPGAAIHYQRRVGPLLSDTDAWDATRAAARSFYQIFYRLSTEMLRRGGTPPRVARAGAGPVVAPRHNPSNGELKCVK